MIREALRLLSPGKGVVCPLFPSPPFLCLFFFREAGKKSSFGPCSASCPSLYFQSFGTFTPLFSLCVVCVCVSPLLAQVLSLILTMVRFFAFAFFFPHVFPSPFCDDRDPTKHSEPSELLPRRASRTETCLTGSVSERTTRSGTTSRDDTGEEPSSACKRRSENRGRRNREERGRKRERGMSVNMHGVNRLQTHPCRSLPFLSLSLFPFFPPFFSTVPLFSSRASR